MMITLLHWLERCGSGKRRGTLVYHYTQQNIVLECDTNATQRPAGQLMFFSSSFPHNNNFLQPWLYHIYPVNEWHFGKDLIKRNTCPTVAVVVAIKQESKSTAKILFHGHYFNWFPFVEIFLSNFFYISSFVFHDSWLWPNVSFKLQLTGDYKSVLLFRKPFKAKWPSWIRDRQGFHCFAERL